VVVLFHSVQCAFCSLLSNNLMTVARILEDLHQEIAFYRIDGDKNDLQWQFTMEVLPSLIIFPAGS
jgi:thioredoxin-related protein